MAETVLYNVPGMTCDHCVNAVKAALSSLDGVARVEVDLATKAVRVSGDGFDDAALRAAIEDAGYEALR